MIDDLKSLFPMIWHFWRIFLSLNILGIMLKGPGPLLTALEVIDG